MSRSTLTLGLAHAVVLGAAAADTIEEPETGQAFDADAARACAQAETAHAHAGRREAAHGTGPRRNNRASVEPLEASIVRGPPRPV